MKPVFVQSQNYDEMSAVVPTGRVERLLKIGSIATGIAGNVAIDGVRTIANGKRPNMAQLLLTPTNTLRFTSGLSHMRGAALKLGQMLSMDSGLVLSDELTTILSQLRNNARHMPPKQLQNVLNSEWGAGWYSRFSRFDVRPFAAASIGQVHFAKTHDGRTMAIKVQYPGVRASIDSDVDNIAALMRLPGLVPKKMNLKPLLSEAKRQLHTEADYSAEAQHLSSFGRLLTKSNSFTVPEVHDDFCTSQILAMDYLEGKPLETLEDANQTVRDEVATSLIDLVLKELFVFNVMQTDPNLANFRYNSKTKRVVLLDFGAVQPIAPELSANFRTLARIALNGEEEEMRSAMQRIGYFDSNTAQHHKDLILSMFKLAVSPLKQETPFNFGNNELLEQLRDMGLNIGKERELAHIPPAATLFLHRKIGGMYLMATKLRAHVNLRPMIEAYMI